MSHITEATAAEQDALGARAIAAVEVLEMDLTGHIERCVDARSAADTQYDREMWREREMCYRLALITLRKAMRGEP